MVPSPAPADPMSTHDPMAHHATTESPNALLEDWRAFVDGCELGYEYNVMEYHQDLSVRDQLEAWLRDPALPDGFPARVAEVDERFRALLQPGVEVGPADDPWWHRGVLLYAGDSLAEGLREWFGVEVQVRD